MPDLKTPIYGSPTYKAVSASCSATVTILHVLIFLVGYHNRVGEVEHSCQRAPPPSSPCIQAHSHPRFTVSTAAVTLYDIETDPIFVDAESVTISAIGVGVDGWTTYEFIETVTVEEPSTTTTLIGTPTTLHLRGERLRASDVPSSERAVGGYGGADGLRIMSAVPVDGRSHMGGSPTGAGNTIAATDGGGQPRLAIWPWRTVWFVAMD
ncbi:hypothetical protein FB451DRAFT_1169267 [Mycena latifolia]|nr:hypothetical protein FB451DRAFT_1169267 [Mycena latifolia]